MRFNLVMYSTVTDAPYPVDVQVQMQQKVNQGWYSEVYSAQLLVYHTIVQVQMQQKVGQGRFGEVYGVQLLMYHTIVQVQMQQKVGQGRYGEVYSAQLLMYHTIVQVQMQQKVGQGRYGEVYSAQLLIYHTLWMCRYRCSRRWARGGTVRCTLQCTVTDVPYHCAGTDAAEGGAGAVRRGVAGEVEGREGGRQGLLHHRGGLLVQGDRDLPGKLLFCPRK